MKFKQYEGLMKEQTSLACRMIVDMQMLIQTREDLMREICSPLNDGSIDPGDFDAIAEHLLEVVKTQPAYQEYVRFTKERRKEYLGLYKALAQGDDATYDAFIELQQRISVDSAVQAMFESLVQMGVVVDKTGQLEQGNPPEA